jgi:integrase
MKFYINNGYLYFRSFPRPYDECKFYLDVKIEKRFWSAKSQKVYATHLRSELINKLIRRVQDLAEVTQLEYKIEGKTLTAGILHRTLTDNVFGVTVDQMSLKEYCEYYLLNKKDTLKSQTLKSFKNSIRAIFQMYPELNWNKITSTWRQRSYSEMMDHYSHNTVVLMFNQIKTIIMSAKRDGITDIKIPDSFTMSLKVVNTVYINKDDINTLYTHDYNDDKLTNAVRIFMLLYSTGQRISDFDKVLKGIHLYIQGVHMVRFQQTKTNTFVSIPVTPVLNDLINIPPVIIHLSIFNTLIKKAAMIAGLSDYKKISSHTARRSCATNLVLEGFPLQMVKDITGHKTESQLMKYIRYNDIQAAIKVSEHDKYRSLYAAL